MSVVDSPESPGARAAARKERVAGWRVGLLASPAAPVYGALIGIIILAWIVVTIDGGNFLTTGNIVNMLQRSVALGIVSLGQTVVILLGSLDLSVPFMVSLANRQPRVSQPKRSQNPCFHSRGPSVLRSEGHRLSQHREAKVGIQGPRRFRG